MASISIIIPGPDRAAASRVDSRLRDDLRSGSVGTVRTSPERAAESRATSAAAPASTSAAGKLPPVVWNAPRNTLAFLAQQIAQQDEPTADEPAAPTAVRLSALRAYGIATESTVSFLSPEPFCEIRV